MMSRLDKGNALVGSAATVVSTRNVHVDTQRTREHNACWTHNTHVDTHNVYVCTHNTHM